MCSKIKKLIEDTNILISEKDIYNNTSSVELLTINIMKIVLELHQAILTKNTQATKKAVGTLYWQLVLTRLSVGVIDIEFLFKKVNRYLNNGSYSIDPMHIKFRFCNLYCFVAHFGENPKTSDLSELFMDLLIICKIINIDFYDCVEQIAIYKSEYVEKLKKMDTW